MILKQHRNWGWVVGAACVALVATVALWNRASEGQAPPKKPVAPSKPVLPPKDRELQAFMRKKLEASNQILEGLCTEDLELVKAGAEKLQQMSDAERWRVSNDVMYKQFSNEFRSITRQLVKAAEEDNVDRATLKWLDATVSCLDCHRFVRGMRIVDSTPR